MVVIQTYIVKAGDTLYGISNQFGVSVTELASLNDIKGDSLRVGQVLKIPSNSGVNPNNMFMYTVKAGDSLYSIASKYGTTVQKIKDLNYLSSNNLSIGQVLRIPETYTKEDEMMLPNYTNYVVKKGDTLYSIANNYGINVDNLIKDNSLTSNNLSVGQVLRIRVPSDEVYEKCFGADYNIPDSFTSYIVKKGDSLYSIANKYNTTVNQIINLNNLKSTSLSIGQQLKIPNTNSSTNANVYIVKSGDNLYSIARKFNTTIDTIKKKNKLSSNLLSVGQKLII